MFDLTGKKVLVTGGSRGIGRGISLCLARQGADVAINYVSKLEDAEEVVVMIKNLGREAWAVQADVGEKDQVVNMMTQIKDKWGRLDILVNNAGIVRQHALAETSEEEWDQVLKTNLKGQFLCIQAAIELMNSGAKIINLTSIASGGVGGGFGNVPAYVASKGGVIGLTEDLAAELGAKGINVNAIAPGFIETDMTKAMLESEQAKQAFLTHIPKGRIGKPEDIGAAAAFLASDEADYVTGSVVYVDGGWLAA